MEKVVLKVQPRTVLGKKVKRLRAQGITPLHLYGPGTEPRALQANTSELLRALARVGTHSPLTVVIEGEDGEHLTFVREMQWHPLHDILLHVDLLKVDVAQRLTAEVPLVLVGESPVVRETGASVVQLVQSLEVEALPLEVPAHLELDLSLLTEPGQVLRAGDVPLPEGVTLITDPDTAVVTLETVRGVMREEEVEEAPAVEAGEVPVVGEETEE